MPPQCGLDAFVAPFALGTPADCVLDISPEWLPDIEIVYIWFTEYVVYCFEEVFGDGVIPRRVFSPHLHALLKAYS